MDKIKTTIVLSLGTLILAISGCSSHTPLYNYGDYSESYYALKKESTADTALEYKQALEYCIKEADDSRSGRVPPGIYANLGYLYLKAGKNKKAVEYFTKEKSTYPEAAFFMDKMINKVETLEGQNEK